MANLAHVPGLAGYLASQQNTQQAEAGQLQQFGQVMGLRQALMQQEQMRQAQAQEAQAREALKASGGDPSAAAEALLKSGNAAGAAKLAPLIQATKKPEPKEFAPPEIIRLQEALSSLPASDPRRAPIEARIKMLGERPAGVNVYNSGLTAGVDEKGNPVFVQSSGRADVPPRVVPGVRPPPNAAVAKESREAAENQITVDAVRKRIQSMSQKLQGNTGIVGPAGLVRRGAEVVGGMASPDMPTPALDYQNEMRILLSDVRKMVEKDPNLSKDEREALYETLGGGFMQTPGSALRTLGNILDKVENKSMTTIGKNQGIEAAVKDSGWSYEPDKFEYRVVDGKVQRRAK